MKRNTATVLLGASLVVVALLLGIANKLRTDRRAQKVAESLDRPAAPSGTIIHEGPGAASTFEPGATDAKSALNEDATSSPDALRSKTAARFDRNELRLAVMKGEADRVARMTGRLETEDAGILFALISEIPPDLRSDLRGDIKLALVKLLQETPGDDSARYLLGMMMQGGFLVGNVRGTTLWHLGLRKFREAAPFMEGLAFSGSGLDTEDQRRVDRFNAVRALIHLDPTQYLPRVSREIRTGSESTLHEFVGVIQVTAETGKVDVSSAIPDLQSRFQTLPSENWWSRRDIGKALASCAISAKSTPTKSWLIAELKKRLAAEDLVWEAREAYIEILKTVEGKAVSK